ncbi:non-specific serine/threonine protein kinase [Trifolium repens]|nr:non-specific serine/threonine protein kinase [Trifolium repens]
MRQFGIVLKDRFGILIDPPTFVPPMKFKLDLSRVTPEFVDDLPEDIELLSYTHDGAAFGIEYEKKLIYYDINDGFLILPYEDFGEKALHKTTTTLNLIDDCGNKWNCVLIFGCFPYKHFKIGGEWKRLVAARRLEVGDHITVGGYKREKNEDFYLLICR